MIRLVTAAMVKNQNRGLYAGFGLILFWTIRSRNLNLRPCDQFAHCRNFQAAVEELQRVAVHAAHARSEIVEELVSIQCEIREDT